MNPASVRIACPRSESRKSMNARATSDSDASAVTATGYSAITLYASGIAIAVTSLTIAGPRSLA
jgi:hypothetical protein